MKLKQLFKYYEPLDFKGDTDIEISNIATHSNSIKPSGLFFAFKGEKTDGCKFIKDAVNKGAVAVVTEENYNISSIAKIKVSDSKLALSRWAAAFYDFPVKNMEVTGVTGTNGKTTVSNLIYRILLKEGKAGLIGTSGYFFNTKRGKFSMTTPQPHELHFIFRKMLEAGVKKVVMEVSSHALELKRVNDIKFKNVVFTNLTQDHLDFHGNIENYYLSKLKLFSLLEKKNKASAIINNDDKYGREIINDIDFSPTTYGITGNADYGADIKEIGLDGSRFILFTSSGKNELKVKLIGKYNVYNCLAAIAWALEGGRNMEHVCKLISEAPPVPGRLDIVKKHKKNNKVVIIDYAHTPDALKNVMKTLKKIIQDKLICVFGCGGDRDKTKRPLMGETAGIYADIVYITSDNPRSEDPYKIIHDIEPGIRKTNTLYYIIPDRQEAIKKAISEADNNDCVLIAGKGDEEYQIIGDNRIPFSDYRVAEKCL